MSPRRRRAPTPTRPTSLRSQFAGAAPTPDLRPERRSSWPDVAACSSATIAGPPRAPTVVMLHGWTATADLNFFTCYRPLADHYRVVGVRPSWPRTGDPHPQGVPAGGLCRRRGGSRRRSSGSTRSSPSATRWADRSRSSCGIATATGSMGWCLRDRSVLRRATPRAAVVRRIDRAGDASPALRLPRPGPGSPTRCTSSAGTSRSGRGPPNRSHVTIGG